MPYPEILLEQYRVLQDPNESLHRTINDIVASYNSAWDPLAELVQNAIDAINQRGTTEGTDFSGQLRITINRDSRYVTVEDNGIGIRPNSRGELLLPGGSFKNQGNTYGHKGLGFTYCSHIAEEVEVQTEDSNGNGEHWSLTGGFRWLNDPMHAPSVSDVSGQTIRHFKGSGTAVRLKLAVGDYEEHIANTAVLDSFFDWADDDKLLPFVLRTRTAIGQVGHYFGNSPPVEVTITIAFDEDGKDLREANVPYRFFDFSVLPPFNQANHPQAQEYAANIVKNPHVINKTNFGIQHVFAHDAAQPTQPLVVGRNRGGVRFGAYIYACGKANLREALRYYDPRLVEDSSQFQHLAISTDVHLAIDGMPCGVPIDSWNNFGGHEERYFAIVNTELRFGHVLDAGRKTITRYYVDLIVNKLVTMTKDEKYFDGLSFYQLSTHLHVVKKIPHERAPISYVERWDKYDSLPAETLVLQKIPDDELGVYVLFGELIGRGHIPGYTFRYVSGGAIYDAAFAFEVDVSNPLHTNASIDGGKTIFGVGNSLQQEIRRTPTFPKYQWRDPGGREFLVAEFKVTAGDLLRDLQRRKTQKSVDQIEVLVCMTCNENEVKQLNAALVPVVEAARMISGVTHRLYYGARDIAVISLEDIIRELKAAGRIE